MSKVSEFIEKESRRQADTLCMIASENYTSKAVREAVGSVFMHKYAEGYPGKRYYQGNENADGVESLAIERAKKLFKTPHANVQPYSGSIANAAVLMALASAGNPTIMGLSLSSGGHLTHGHPNITFSGKFFRSVQFDVDADGRFDFVKIKRKAIKEEPVVMIVGTTSYPLKIDWKAFYDIAQNVGAYLVADISHVAGLVAGGVYPSPINYSHIITTTTHKTLRGPRGAIIMATQKGLKKDPDLAANINKTVFPGMQGGPHMNVIAGIAVALDEASKPGFKKYSKGVVDNAKVLSNELIKGGLSLVCGGTESHLMVIDLRPQELCGNVVAFGLEKSGIVANKNTIPHDIMPPMYPSGIRLGTAALTIRGLGEREMKLIAQWILQVIDIASDYKLPNNKKNRRKFMEAFREKISESEEIKALRKETVKLCKKFPLIE